MYIEIWLARCLVYVNMDWPFLLFSVKGLAMNIHTRDNALGYV